MIKTFLLLLMLFPSILFGQETKRISDKATNETFFVLKSDKSTKHGVYKKLSYRNTLLIKGIYKQGLKDSIWECYNFDGQISLKYDYSKNELLFYKPSDKIKKYKFINEKNNDDTSLDRPPIFLGGDDAFTSDIVRNLRYPVEALENGISGKVFVSFVVDKSGKTSNYKIEKPLGFGLDLEALWVLKLQPDNWLPAIQNGQAVDIEVIYPVMFKLQ